MDQWANESMAQFQQLRATCHAQIRPVRLELLEAEDARSHRDDGHASGARCLDIGRGVAHNLHRRFPRQAPARLGYTPADDVRAQLALVAERGRVAHPSDVSQMNSRVPYPEPAPSEVEGPVLPRVGPLADPAAL